METGWSFIGDLEAAFSSLAPSPVDSMDIFSHSEATNDLIGSSSFVSFQQAKNDFDWRWRAGWGIILVLCRIRILTLIRCDADGSNTGPI